MPRELAPLVEYRTQDLHTKVSVMVAFVILVMGRWRLGAD